MKNHIFNLLLICLAFTFVLLTPQSLAVDQNKTADSADYTKLTPVDLLKGQSGKLQVTLQAPESPDMPKILSQSLKIIKLLPFSIKQEGRIGRYIMGLWPFESGKTTSVAYSKPAGFVEVTKENINLPISEHFRLGDFVSKDQPDIWPKYLVLDLKLVDKLELIIAELNKKGYSIQHLAILCGFRSPYCNSNYGDPSGRGKLSRHMYGDAIDIYVDNNQDGWTDDINHDGRVDIHDSEILAKVVEQIETRHSSLVGGLGIYPGTSTHGPFIHVDVRGQAARWRG